MSLIEKLLNKSLPSWAVVFEAVVLLVLIAFLVPYGLGKLKLGTTANGVTFAVLFTIWVVFYVKVFRARI